jgi:hypothetical protein
MRSGQNAAVCPELGPVGKGPGIVPWIGSLAHRLGEAVDGHDRGAAQVRGFPFQDAEKPVVASVAAADPDLVEAGHVLMRRLPLASSGEGWWRGGGYGIEDSMELDSYLEGKLLEELDGGHGLVWVVPLGALEEVNEPRLRVGHASPTLDSPVDQGP